MLIVGHTRKAPLLFLIASLTATTTTTTTTPWRSSWLVAVQAFSLFPSNHPDATTTGLAQQHGSLFFEPELPADLPRRQDVLVALQAVRRACKVTERLQPDKDENDRQLSAAGAAHDVSSTSSSIGVVEKKDLSPVTVADFAVQGLILHALQEQFPNDGFIAEEDSSSLRMDNDLCQQVADAAGLTTESTITAIDLGKSYEKWNTTSNGISFRRPSRVWCCDPIDGTRGFLRGKRPGGQYAIALALVEDGIPVIGILGCPNLPTNEDQNYEWRDDDETVEASSGGRGCIFVASRGGGCYQLHLNYDDDRSTAEPRKLQVTSDTLRSPQESRFCIGVERYSDALGQAAGMAQYLHGFDRALDAKTGEIIRARRMDSQAKHGVIARGGAELYVRLPKPGYVEWIWDHAAGNVVIEEAGGTMTDVEGRSIDFSLGAKLSPHVRGVLMSAGGKFHSTLVDAYAAVDKQ